MDEKLKNIQNRLRAGKLGGVILFSPSNIYYMTGFRTDGGAVLLTRNDLLLAAGPLDYSAALHSAKCRVEKSLSLEKFLKKHRGIGAIGAAREISFDRYKTLHSVFGKKIVFLDDVLFGARAVKTACEIKKIRAACRLAKKTMDFAVKTARPGMAECALASEIECFMRKAGSDGESFATIVASGPNTAFPHHIPSERKFGRNDIVYADLGCSYRLYNSDLTNTFFLGKINKYGLKIRDIVKEAHRLALNAVRPGVPCKDVDSAARNFIAENGLEDYFIHSTGHGVGLDIHEAPAISRKSSAVLEENMVITVEPGIYIPGRFGVRIEDTVLVTKKGCEVLTK